MLRPNISWVREFYANFPSALVRNPVLLSGTPKYVTVRGVKVDISPATIRKVLGLPTPAKGAMKKFDDFKEGLAITDVAVSIASKPPQGVVPPAYLLSSQLNEWGKVMGFLVRTLLYPVKQTSKFPLQMCVLMHAMSFPKIPIPAEYFIYTAIHDAAVKYGSTQLASLVFPSFITALATFAGVPSLEGDVYANLSSPMDMLAIKKSVSQSVDDYVEPLQTTLLKMHMDAQLEKLFDRLNRKVGAYFSIIEERLNELGAAEEDQDDEAASSGGDEGSS